MHDSKIAVLHEQQLKDLRDSHAVVAASQFASIFPTNINSCLLVTDFLQIDSTWHHVHDSAQDAAIANRLVKRNQSSQFSVLELVHALVRYAYMLH